jgi:glycosyltransferase involved in cell wall biosynthesis
MPKHYAWGDVLVLPTISEGSANVCHESLAFGLPVITTPNAGSTVTDGVDGLVVPIRSPRAIAESLQRLTERPEILPEMSRNAARRARDYSPKAYAARLLEAVDASRT